jgi:hypothetical protein
MEEINPKINLAINTLKNEIMVLKKTLHFNIVANDKKHDAADMSSMMSFHSVFLHIIGYWIGLLDGSSVPKPTLSSKEQPQFDKLTSHIKNIASYNYDSKTLLYAMLFKYSVQHPFDLGEKINNSE